MSVDIQIASTPAEEKAFREFVWTHYAGDPYWVPPLVSMRRETFDRQHAAAWEYLRGEYFIARRGGTIVGTIAAFINPRHNEFRSESIAWFGAFETIDDPAVAAALLDAASDWARAQGVTALRGPQTFTTHEEVGLLVEGFGHPMILMPYHKPFYERLILGAGFSQCMEMVSYEIMTQDVLQNGVVAKLARLSEGLEKRGKITIRGLDRRQLKSEFALFREIYNDAWASNWGFVPMTPRELDELVASLGQFFDPSLAFFSYVDGQPAGFAIGLPDLNQVLKRARAHPNTPEIITLARAFYLWKVRRIITRARVPLMGVRPAYRNKGLDVVLYSHLMQAIIDSGYVGGDAGWILTVNEQMTSIAVKHLGGTIYRTYRQYERAL